MTEIKEIKDKIFWNYSLQEFQDANIYQTWNFAALAQNEKIVTHLAFYLDNNLVGLAQVRVRKVPIINRGIAYILNGPVWQKNNQENNIQIFNDIISALIKEFVKSQKLLLRIKPYIFSDKMSNFDFIKQLGFRLVEHIRQYHTLVLYLDKDLDEIRKSLNRKWRNHLNQSERNGLKILEGDDRKIYSDFLEIYYQMIARKKFNEFVDPYKIGKMSEELDDGFKLKVFIAYKDEVPAAGVVASVIGDTAIYLLGASNEIGMSNKASYLLQWEMIKWLKKKGCQRYDLGGIDIDGNPGVYKFKSGITDHQIFGMGTYETFESRLSKYIVSFGELLKR